MKFGVAPERAAEVARRIADLPGLRLRGVFTFAGHAYLAETPEGVARVGRDEGAILADAAARVRCPQTHSRSSS